MLTRCLALLALCLYASPAALAQATAWEAAYPVSGYASSELNLREGPTTEHRVLTVIPAGTLLYRGPCEDGWCPVKYREHRGFASERYISGSQRHSTPQPSARSSSSSGRRAVAVRCSGTTQRGTRCKRKTKSANGRCYQHGG